jgi:hypothetical protein
LDVLAKNIQKLRKLWLLKRSALGRGIPDIILLTKESCSAGGIVFNNQLERVVLWQLIYIEIVDIIVCGGFPDPLTLLEIFWLSV